jgi:hypothetical protein
MSLACLVSVLVDIVQEQPGGKLVSVAPNNKLGQRLSMQSVQMLTRLACCYLVCASSASDVDVDVGGVALTPSLTT